VQKALGINRRRQNDGRNRVQQGRRGSVDHTDADDTLWDTSAVFANAQLQLITSAEYIANQKVAPVIAARGTYDDTTRQFQSNPS